MKRKKFEDCFSHRNQRDPVSNLYEELEHVRQHFEKNLEEAYEAFQEEGHRKYLREREQVEKLAELIASRQFQFVYSHGEYRSRIDELWKRREGRFEILKSEEELKEVYDALCDMIQEYRAGYTNYVSEIKADAESAGRGLDAERKAVLENHIAFMLSMEMYNKIANAGVL